jgi:hypothetical protein
MGWLEYVIGGTAVLISAISLYVANSANRAQERMMAASTWPHVQYGTGNRLDDGSSSITFNLHNAGVGPARIKTVQVIADGAPMVDAASLLRTCCGTAHGHVQTITSHPERVLVAGEEMTFLRYDEKTADPAVWEKLNRARFDVRLLACYCSVLDDCWMLDSELDDPQPVAACPSVPPRAALSRLKAGGAPRPACALDQRPAAAAGAAAGLFFRCVSRKASTLPQASIWLSFFVKPWPSSSNTTYSTGTLFFCTAATMSSDSGLITRGSLAPCSTMSGRLILSAWNSGEVSMRKSRWVAGSPISW